MWWIFFFFKQKTAYEMRISDWSSDVCSSDLEQELHIARAHLFSVYPVNRSRTALDAPDDLDLVELVEHRRRLALAVVQHQGHVGDVEIGRASCRERVCQYV